MIIKLSPVFSTAAMDVQKEGDVLTINGEPYDFSGLPDGATITAWDAAKIPGEYFRGDVERIGGVLHLTLILPHGPSPSEAVAFPAPLIDPPDGPLDLPRAPDPVIEEEVAHVDA